MDFFLKSFFIVLCMVALKRSYKGIAKVNPGSYVALAGAFAPWVYSAPSGGLSQNLFDSDAILRALLTAFAVVLCSILYPVQGFFNNSIFRAIVVLSAWALLTSFWAPNQLFALSKAALFFCWLLNVNFFARYLSDIRICLRFLRKLPSVMCIQTLAYILLLGFDNFMSDLKGSEIIRWSISIPTVNANYLAFVLILSLLSLFYGPKSKMKTTKILLTLTLIGLTYSRIGIFLALLIIFIYTSRNLNGKLRFFLVGTPAGIVAIINWQKILPFLEVVTLRGESQRNLSTLSGRIIAWQDLFANTDPDQLIVGRGYYSGFRFATELLTQRQQSNLDSSWIEALLTLGYVGMALLIYLFFQLIKNLNKASNLEYREFYGILVLTSFNFSFLNSLFMSPEIISFAALVPFLIHETSELKSKVDRKVGRI